jgi:N4-gp56 family major capsid protein
VSINTYGSAGNQLTNEGRTYYAMDLIERLLPKIPLFQFGQKRTIPKRTGGFGSGEVQFRKFAALATNTTPTTETAIPSPKTLSISTVTTNLQLLCDWVKMSDIAVDASIDDIMAEADRLLGESAGQSLHLLLISVLEAATTNSTWPVGATTVNDLIATDVLNSSIIKRAARDLEIRNVPKFDDKYYVMAIHPSQAHDLRNDSQWRNVSEYNGGAANSGGPDVLSGELGQIHGVRFVVTTQITRTTNSSSVAYAKSFMFGPDCWGQFDFETMGWSDPNPDTNQGISLYAEKPGTKSKVDPFGMWGFISYKLAYAFKVLDTDRIQQVWTAYSS